MKDIGIVILAAGKGTRMGGSLPKVLYLIADKPMIYWPLHLIKQMKLEPAYVVTGYKASDVEKTINKYNFKVIFIRQVEQRGTAHSLKLALKKIPPTCTTILVLYGDDSVLYKPKTILDFIKHHKNNKNKATLLTLERKTPTDIGCLRVDKNGNVIDVMTLSMIIKEKLKTHQILCGAFCFERNWIEEVLPLIPPSTLSGEYTLPGIIKVAASRGEKIDTYKKLDSSEWGSINTTSELKEVEKMKLKQLSK